MSDSWYWTASRLNAVLLNLIEKSTEALEPDALTRGASRKMNGAQGVRVRLMRSTKHKWTS